MSPKKVTVEQAQAAPPPKALVLTPLLKSVKQARKVSTPLVMIETSDPGATESAILQLEKGKYPTFRWDSVRGLHGIGEASEEFLKNFPPTKGTAQMETRYPHVALSVCGKLEDHSIIFFHNLHEYVKEPKVKQALWNLRDEFKVSHRCIFGLGVAFVLPAEIAGDCIVLDEPLPTREELDGVLDDHIEAAAKRNNVITLDPIARREILDAIIGLPMYTADQCLALSTETAAIHIPRLWERKIKAIENNNGMRVWRGQPWDSLDNLREIDNVVAYVKELWEADAFGAIAFIDEGDKALAGGMSDYSGDSGVAKDQIGTVLSYMEDTNALGLMLAGLTGCGKSQLVKALGATSRKPVIVFDLGGMKGGHVGESERTIRQNLKVLTATAGGQGRILFMMTANQTVLFTPEVNRRFRKQFFFDIPKQNEDIWEVWLRLCNIDKDKDDRQKIENFSLQPGKEWTGAEIKAACEEAAMLGKTITQVSRYTIPMSVAKADILKEMRSAASGHFLSAAMTDDGWYREPKIAATVKADRKIVGSGRALQVMDDEEEE